MMRDRIIGNLKSRFDTYAEMNASVDDNAMVERLDAPKHKSLLEHLWCVVGARESYAKSLDEGEWLGFNCSMKEFSQADFEASLGSSASAVLDAIERVDDWTDAREELLALLYEHEVMHEGQIIRHMYGMERELPKSVYWA